MTQSGSTFIRRNFGVKSLTKGNTINKPIQSVYKRKKYGVKQKKTSQNKEAIVKLSRQVKSLQLTRYGEVQWQTQYTSLNSSIYEEFPQRSHPILFCANSLYNNTALYRGNVTIAGQPEALVLPSLKSWHKQDFRPDIEDQYQWIPINNQEVVSQTEYLPIATRLRMQFNIRAAQSSRDPIKFRVTFFSVRNQPAGQPTNSVLMNLPAKLGAYWHMAADNPEDRNYFSKIRHKIHYDRWVVINPPANPLAVSSLSKTLTYNYKFPDLKSLKKGVGTHPVPAGTNLASSIPDDEVVWCLISSNYDNLAIGDSVVDINMSRVNTWRDHKGVSVI